MFEGKALSAVFSYTHPDLVLDVERLGTFAAGETGSYRISVANQGTVTAAPPISVADRLPPGFSLVGVSGDGWTCAAAGQVITCTTGSALAAGAALPPLDLTVAVGARVPPTVTNRVVVRSAQDPPWDLDHGNNNAFTVTPIETTPGMRFVQVMSGTNGAGERSPWCAPDVLVAYESGMSLWPARAGNGFALDPCKPIDRLGASASQAVTTNSTADYQAYFTAWFDLPADAMEPSVVIELLADDGVQTFLNGRGLGIVNLRDGPGVLALSDPLAFQPGTNSLRFHVVNFPVSGGGYGGPIPRGGSGDAMNLEFEVTVAYTLADHTPPVISGVPADQVREATGPDGAVATWIGPTAIDDVDGVVPVTCAPLSGSTFPLGETNVTCFANDAAGNTASASFNVLVRDTTPPVIHGLPEALVYEATGPAGASVTWTSPTAVDIVDGPVPVACAPLSGSTLPLGETSVTCSANDAAGNTAGASFNVLVRDTTPPVIHAVTAAPDTLWPPDHRMVAVMLSVSATDMVTAMPTCDVVTVASNEPVNGLGDGDTSPDWLVVGPLAVELRAERAGGGGGRVYTLGVRCRDSSGNTSSSPATVRVPHSRQR
jgi:uncharacterized repeat protein (TIGR01451 family)